MVEVWRWRQGRGKESRVLLHPSSLHSTVNKWLCHTANNLHSSCLISDRPLPPSSSFSSCSPAALVLRPSSSSPFQLFPHLLFLSYFFVSFCHEEESEQEVKVLRRLWENRLTAGFRAAGAVEKNIRKIPDRSHLPSFLSHFIVSVWKNSYIFFCYYCC